MWFRPKKIHLVSRLFWNVNIISYFVNLITVWFGVIFVRSGLYEDGVFRFNIILPENFPDGEHPVRNNSFINRLVLISILDCRKLYFNQKCIILW